MLPDKDEYKTSLMEGLKLEFEKQKNLLEDKQVCSIYFGGGTPALLGPTYIFEILSWIKHKTPTCEITLEANPEVINYQLIKDFKASGINRISIGIQSFDDILLKTLGRTHDAKKAQNSIIQAFEGGIDNISIDLMYDLPGQSLKNWQDTLDLAVKLPITHLSLYNLTIEPHTLFYKKQALLKKILPSEDESLDMYKKAIVTLEENGLKQYEISAFAKDSKISYHNIGYWTFRPFLGFGPSAFSFYEGKRFRNIANLNKYLKLLKSGLTPIDFEEKLDPLSSLKEALTIQLRLLSGIDLRDFKNLDQDTLTNIKKLIEEGFLAQSNNNLRLTQKGILFYDSVAVELI